MYISKIMASLAGLCKRTCKRTLSPRFVCLLDGRVIMFLHYVDKHENIINMC